MTLTDLLTRLRAAERERDDLMEALTPSAETKAAYIGEFVFDESSTDEDGNDVKYRRQVPWTTIKAIMAAIKARALKKAPSHE